MLFVRKGSNPILTKHLTLINRLNFKGPYSPAILHFRLSFPATYPFSPPLVTFYTDIFHPLLTPLTTATFSSMASENDPDGTAMQDRLPPGAFSLKHGFPRWYPKGNASKAASVNAQTSTESSNVGNGEHDSSSNVTPTAARIEDDDIVHVVDILRYIRQSFESAPVLDSVPFEAAGNPGAWYAWRAYRLKVLEKECNEGADLDVATPSKGHARTPSKPSHGRASSRGVNRSQSETPGRPKRPSEWNWEGVWEQRVKRAVQDSVNEGTLFGVGGESEIAFTDIKREDIEEIQGEMRQQLRASEQ